MTNKDSKPGPANATGLWLHDATHQAWLKHQSSALLTFFDASQQDEPGFAILDHAGQPLPSDVQELHTTSRMIHSYALGALQGHAAAE